MAEHVDFHVASREAARKGVNRVGEFHGHGFVLEPSARDSAGVGVERHGEFGRHLGESEAQAYGAVEHAVEQVDAEAECAGEVASEVDSHRLVLFIFERRAQIRADFAGGVDAPALISRGIGYGLDKSDGMHFFGFKDGSGGDGLVEPALALRCVHVGLLRRHAG